MNGKHLLVIALTAFTLIACNQDAETAETSSKTEATATQTTTPQETTQEAAKAPASDPHPGMAIHEQNCAACHISPHDEAFYTRPDRKIQSYDKLQGMVRMCDANLGTQLFDEDMEQIGDYLNQAFYKFEK